MERKNTPKISVIVPVYNAEKFLNDCIDSLLKQTIFDDIELIFVNDASNDSSLDILTSRLEKYNNVIILNNEKNLRQGGARNKGIRAASGEYIGFIDSDDFVSSDLFEQLYALAKKNDCDSAYCNLIEVKENALYSEMTFDKEPDCSFKVYDFKNDNRGDYIAKCTRSVVSAIYRKNILFDNDLFFPENVRFEDNYWVTLVNCYVDRVAQFDNYIGYYYRQNDSSTVHLRDNYKLYDERIKVEELIISELKRRELFDSNFEAWEYWYVYRYAVNTFYSYVALFTHVPYERIAVLKKTLESTFPDWRKNKYLAENNDRQFNKYLNYFDKDDNKLSTRMLYFLINKRKNLFNYLHRLSKHWR